jgi:hypothetical protein
MVLRETRPLRLGPADGADEAGGALRSGVGLAGLEERRADAATAPLRIDPEIHTPRAVRRSEHPAATRPRDGHHGTCRILDEDPKTIRLRRGLLHMTDGRGRLPLRGRGRAVQELDGALEVRVRGLARTKPFGQTGGDGGQIGGHDGPD